VQEEIDGPLFTGTVAGIEIAEAASGKILYARNSSLLLRPASNAKLFTSAAAVLGLPPAFVFETRLDATDSSMHTIVCSGGGDPLFTEQDIQKLAEIAQQAGVLRVDTLLLDGSLYADDYFGKGWMWDDETDPFMPYLCAFPISGNTVTVRVKKSSKSVTGLDVTTSPSSELFRFDTAESVRNIPFRIERFPRSNDFRIQGTPAPNRSASERFSVWEPQRIFADRLRQALIDTRLADSAVIVRFVDNASSRHGTTSTIPIGSVRRPLDAVLEVMNKDSDNLCAEAVLRALSFGSGRRRTAVSAEDGLTAMRQILAAGGAATDDIALLDGSGISFYNLVTPEATGRVLRKLAASPAYERFRGTLAVGGVDGTLRSRMHGLPAAKVFWGKTGTVRGVSALSGYVQAPGGRLLTVVLFMQNFVGKPAPYRAAQDRLVKFCYDYSASFAAPQKTATKATQPR